MNGYCQRSSDGRSIRGIHQVLGSNTYAPWVKMGHGCSSSKGTEADPGGIADGDPDGPPPPGSAELQTAVCCWR